MTHMRTLKIIGVAVLAACALSVAVVAQASASTFLASAVGALILDNQINTHLFKTDGGVVECLKGTSHGKTTALSALTQVETVNYASCKAFGSGVTISPAQYEFSADNTVSVLNTITVTSVSGACTVQVSPFNNQNLGKVLYLADPSNSKALNIKAEVSGISYLSSGGICGPTGELKDGTYNGESLAFLDGGGTLGWDK
jgi:hypothetical protein